MLEIPPIEQQRRVQKLLGAGDFRAAAFACRSLTEAHPRFAPGWASACHVALALGNFNKALEYVDHALLLAPDSPRYLILRAQALRAGGAHQEAAAVAAAASRCALDAKAYHELGNYYTGAGAFKEALECATRAVDLAPELAGLRFNRAALLRIVGDLDEAEREYDRVIALKPDEYEAYYNRAHLRHQSSQRNHVAALESVLRTKDLLPRGEVLLRYALAKEFEDLGQYRPSFEQLVRGAGLRRRHIEYDVERDVATVQWIEATFPVQRLRAPGAAHPSSEPIFVVGMPRTGTTLVERVLSQNPDVFAAGELPHFGNALTSAGDSAPGRFQSCRDENSWRRRPKSTSSYSGQTTSRERGPGRDALPASSTSFRSITCTAD